MPLEEGSPLPRLSPPSPRQQQAAFELHVKRFTLGLRFLVEGRGTEEQLHAAGNPATVSAPDCLFVAALHEPGARLSQAQQDVVAQIPGWRHGSRPGSDDEAQRLAAVAAGEAPWELEGDFEWRASAVALKLLCVLQGRGAGELAALGMGPWLTGDDVGFLEALHDRPRPLRRKQVAALSSIPGWDAMWGLRTGRRQGPDPDGDRLVQEILSLERGMRAAKGRS